MYKNKNILISGAGGELGKELVKFFLHKKANLICLLRKKDEKFLNFLKKHKKTKFQKIMCFYFDLVNENAMKSNFIKISKNFSHIDTLINNASIAEGSILEMTPISNIKKVFDVNFFSQISLIQKNIRLLRNSKSPSIINIGSVSGLMAERGFISYGTSKSALMFAGKIIANELKNYNIRVNSIAPNVIDSKMGNKMDPKIKQKFIQSSFTKKQCSFQDVVNVVDFLLSDKSKYINGQIIRVDGGMEN